MTQLVKPKQLSDLLQLTAKSQDKTLVPNLLQPETQSMPRSWSNRLRSFARTQSNLAGKISNLKLRSNKTNKKLPPPARNIDAKWLLKAALVTLHLVLQPILWVPQALVKPHCSISCRIVLLWLTKLLFLVPSHSTMTFQSTKKHLLVMLPMWCKTIFFSLTLQLWRP